jgi:hypothetical protein
MNEANGSRDHMDRDVLSERMSGDGRVRWQARRSADRGRLEVIGIVAPSDVPTIILPLTEAELLELLVGPASGQTETRGAEQ